MKSMRKSFTDFAAIIPIICVAMLAAKPDVYVKSSFEGIKLWAVSVLPSLLPFFFLTTIMSKIGLIAAFSKKAERLTGKIFRCGGISSYAFIMSILSGYPVGAKIISDLSKNGEITQSEATRMSTFCSTSGPLFIIGSVGVGMFGDKRVGYTIIAAHILSAVICGLIFRFYGKKNETSFLDLNYEKSENLLYDCVYSSVVSVALIGGFICVFYVLSDIVINLKLTLPIEKLLYLICGDENSAKGFTIGLIECTRGCKILSAGGVNRLSVAFGAASVSFGGVSVIFQSLMFLKSAKVNIGIFILSKIIQTGVAFLLALTFFNVVF